MQLGAASPTSAAGRGLDTALALASAAVIAWGVLGLGWSVFTVMVAFWFENVVIGGFNVLRMLVSGARIGGAGVVSAGAMATFFTVHFGGFTAASGFMVLVVFGLPELGYPLTKSGSIEPLGPGLKILFADHGRWLAIAALVVTVHAVSFAQWAAATRTAPTPLRSLMAAPYGRMIVLHVSLLAGGALIINYGAPVLGVLLLVALKLGYDLFSLWRAQPEADGDGAESHALRLPVAPARVSKGSMT
jgi:Family of unknown function (DUF6498)